VNNITPEPSPLAPTLTTAVAEKGITNINNEYNHLSEMKNKIIDRGTIKRPTDVISVKVFFNLTPLEDKNWLVFGR